MWLHWLLKEGLFIAIYSDQGWPSVMWEKIKKAYCAAPVPFHMRLPNQKGFSISIGIEGLAWINCKPVLVGMDVMSLYLPRCNRGFNE